VFEILRVESRNIHEDIVVQSDAVDILLCGLAVFRKRFEPAYLKASAGRTARTGDQSAIVGLNTSRRRVPLKRVSGSGIQTKTVVVRRTVVRVRTDAENRRGGVLSEHQIVAPMH